VNGTPVTKASTQIIQQEDISAKVDSIYSRILKGSKSLTDQGYVYEIDSQRYNLGTKEDRAYLAIYSKEKDINGIRRGFYDIDADGIPEVYIQILVYPGKAYTADINSEVMELMQSKGLTKKTSNGIYLLITVDNLTEMKEKYQKLIEDVLKYPQ